MHRPVINPDVNPSPIRFLLIEDVVLCIALDFLSG